ncbi:protein kinase superfamily protein [Actinidia rufa]|uniref:Protein kinase superfamily protein n=1 Tax=Actinidia rufa TaxID=165716 RepID=A0A7J0HAE9_9ERIC|nr:protein kinase superfamily protein [Actinidia rufa]
MERYKVLEELGDGTCGSVYKAINMETSEILAADHGEICLPPPSHHPWPIGAPARPVEGHRAKRKPFEVKSTLIGVESSLVRSVSKQISHSHSPRRRLTIGSAFPTRSGRVSDEIGASFRQAFEKEAPIRGSQGDSPPLCKIPATKSLRKLNHPNIIKLKEIVRENNELFFILDYMEYNLYQIMRGRQKPFLEEEIRAFMSQVLRGLAHMHRNGYFHRDLKPDMWAVGAILAELFTSCPIFPGESPIPHSSIGVPQSTEFTFTSLQPHMLERSFLAMSSPFQQSRCL